MNKLKLITLAILCFGATTFLQAQTADEILANYFENTGGLENWKNVKTLSFEGSVNFQGMELPIAMIQMNNGKSLMKADFQGQTFYQNVYDGETLWATNQMTMAAEKSDAEATKNYKNDINDFPDPFIDYASKGHSVELVGTETVEGTETFKIKLTKEPIMVDGKEEQDITFYYFDAENFVPIVVEKEIKSGPAAGIVGQTKFSDYQEVEGLYFPFSITEGAKGQPGGQQITITNIVINGEVDESIFKFPAPASDGGSKN
ncbi:outer membrane lipoprotein-sorting protein [Aureisphaera sp. CAU 1614]|uniref:Outer membrane lipoprotein-sorting protein n=1 Tax=Halomarinibacterium sedimenti TaxID=2857106 RepID=A0A9X1JWC6_9FLAO|nr:outer membrane lipoprotein-sorting protein [Halomarinibacterium sedimenti]MBW2938974.1 outer membrane lipoprotein-sorting protein [Halomarinibacterium sedimenti]